ncbi:MAG: calcium-binding protein [Pseudobdellovibrionaceae bacterium]
MATLTLEDIVNMYKYGQTTANPGAPVRAEGVTSTIDVDMSEYMADDAWFAVPAQFYIVQDFFNAPSGAFQYGRSYSFTEVKEILEILNPNKHYTDKWDTQQYEWDNGPAGTDSLFNRAMIYNSVQFKLEANFVMDAVGEKSLGSWRVIPDPGFHENFNYDSTDGLAIILNPALEYVYDPDGIGRTVNINFINPINFSSTPYTESMFDQDADQNIPSWSVANFDKELIFSTASETVTIKSGEIVVPFLSNIEENGNGGVHPTFLESIISLFAEAKTLTSPLVLDLDNDGIELTSLTGTGAVYWDLDADGMREASGWVTGGDGLLAIDLNADGIINDNSELFGNTENVSNGFGKLGSYDSNGDGQITAADAAFSLLKVWVDENGNGYSEEAELHTLTELAITSISLAYTDTTITNNGNTIKELGTFVQNGTTKSIVDAWFAYDDVNTVYNGDYTLDVRTLFMPTLRGYGNLPDLHIAMSLDNTGTGNLLDLVAGLASHDFASIFDAGTNAGGVVRGVMMRWAGVDDVDPASRGPNVDAQELAFLEKLVADDFIQRGSNLPREQAGDMLSSAFDQAFDNFYARIMAQTSAGEIFEGTWNYDPVLDSFSGITGLAQDKLDALTLDAAGLASTSERGAFWSNVLRMVDTAVGVTNLSVPEQTALNTAIENSDTALDMNALLTDLSAEVPVTTLTGTTGVDTLTGGVTRDLILANSGNDTLSGGLERDELHGDAGNDSLTGGASSDLLIGGYGNDTYVYNVGDGVDTISEQGSTNGADVDVIQLGAGIALANLTFTRYGQYDLHITITNGGSYSRIIVEDQFKNAQYRVETLKFSDNSTYDLTTASVTSYGTPDDDNMDGISIGGAANDIIYLYEGDDTSYGDTGDDQIYGGSGQDYLRGDAGADIVYGDAGDDHLEGNAGSDALFGGDGNDSLEGGSEDDSLEGGAGNDLMDGGTGNDIYIYGSGNDVIKESGGSGTDEVRLPSGLTLGSLTFARYSTSANDLIITLSTGASLTVYNTFASNSYAIETIRFFDNSTLALSTQAFTTYGTSGNDNIAGIGASASTNDTIYAYGGDDTVSASDGDDVLYGGDGNDTLTGGNGNDILYGQVGNDTLTGGAGTDTASYSDAGSAVAVSLALTTAQNTLGAGTDTLATIENLTGSGYSDTLTGDGNANVIDGGAGNDTIEGGAGNDTLIGGSGTDLLTYAAATAAISISLAVTSAQVTGGAGSDTISGFENLTGSGYNDSLTGDASANTINGGVGDDTIQGGLGNDILTGGTGIDTLSYSAATAAVTVNLATTASQNTVAAGSDTLSGFENLLGSAYNDTLTGDANANTIEGGLGNDTITGGAGSDTVSYKSATAAVTVNLTTTTAQNTVNAGSDTITGVENILGSAYNDNLTGDANANTIEGGLGNDTLNGGTGTDTLSYAGATAAITLSLATATAQSTGGAGSDTVSNFENLLGSGYNDTLTGDANANTINGGLGNDTIQGGLGNDILSGDAGTDTLSYASAASAVTISLALTSAQVTGGAGTDTISTFENLTGSAYNDTLFGDANANTINGGAGTDTLSYAAATAAITVSLATTSAQATGGAGSDTISNIENLIGSAYNDTLTGSTGTNMIEGGLGNDTMNGGTGTDTLSYASATAGITVSLALTTAQVTGGAGTDTIAGFEAILGSGYADILTGDANVNTLTGGAGNDTLIGGAGIDTLVGGTGADTYKFAAGSTGTSDVVTGFSLAEGDKINVKDVLTGFDPLTKLITDYVEFTTSGSNTIVKIDADGTGTGSTWVQIGNPYRCNRPDRRASPPQ